MTDLVTDFVTDRLDADIFEWRYRLRVAVHHYGRRSRDAYEAHGALDALRVIRASFVRTLERAA